MSCCPQCALPVAAQQEKCPFCDGPLLAAPPLLLRLSKTPDGYALSTGERTLLKANKDGALWKIQRSTGSLILLVVDDAFGREVALVDDEMNTVTTIHIAGKAGKLVTLFSCAMGSTRGIWRIDNDGNVMVTSSNGDLLMHGGRGCRSDKSAVDLLVTPAGADLPLAVTLALAITYEASLLEPAKDTNAS